MSQCFRWACLICAMLLGINSWPAQLLAQATRARSTASSSLCVDMVSLRQGKPLRGLIFSSAAAGPMWMIVQRDLLIADQPTLYQQAGKQERDEAIQAWTDLERRLQAELKTIPNTQLPLKGFYERELARIQELLQRWKSQPEAWLDYRFVWVQLNAKEIGSVRRATPEAQRVAVWAWSERLTDVVTRDRADLERELERLGVDSSQEPPDLSSELAPRIESEQTWAMRSSVVRYALTGGIDFQGTGDMFVRTGNAPASIDMAGLIQKLMAGSVNDLLADLDPAQKQRNPAGNTQDWYRPIIPQAEKLSAREFRATKLDIDPSAEVATVVTALVARIPASNSATGATKAIDPANSAWQIVWSSTQTVRANEVTAQAQQRIADNPQIKSALNLLSALGAGAESEVRKAIRFGAATMAAQQQADQQFAKFRDRITRRLDGPPLH